MCNQHYMCKILHMTTVWSIYIIACKQKEVTLPQHFLFSFKNYDVTVINYQLNLLY